MTKEEIFKMSVIAIYPDYEKVMEYEVITEAEARNYFHYCVTAPINKRSYNDFKTFNEMKEKARTKGIESIMFRSDVLSIEKDTIPDGNNGPMPIFRVKTAYGPFTYYKGGIID